MSSADVTGSHLPRPSPPGRRPVTKVPDPGGRPALGFPASLLVS
jgi:hypothetical protein